MRRRAYRKCNGRWANGYFSDNHTESVMPGSLITVLQRGFAVKYYFRRAEPQKNDNTHFHLIADT